MSQSLWYGAVYDEALMTSKKAPCRYLSAGIAIPDSFLPSLQCEA